MLITGAPGVSLKSNLCFHVQFLCWIQSKIAKFMGQHGAHLGPVGPRWALCWPHEPCYQGYYAMISPCWTMINEYISDISTFAMALFILLTQNCLCVWIYLWYYQSADWSPIFLFARSTQPNAYCQTCESIIAIGQYYGKLLYLNYDGNPWSFMGCHCMG